MNLLDSLPAPNETADAMPRLRSVGMQRIALDAESTGLNPWRGDKAVGLSVAWESDGEVRAAYIAWGHAGGGNYDKAEVVEWVGREIAGLEIYGLNTKFDNRMLRAEGIDLESLGCKLLEVSHAAGLLNSNTRKFSLDALAAEHLDAAKVDLPFHPSRISHVHASQVAEYARQDARLTYRLGELLVRRVEHDGELQRVFTLEQDIAPVVGKMEEAGVFIDVPLLKQYDVETDERCYDLQRSINEAAGFNCSVNSRKAMLKLWRKYGLPLYESGSATRYGADVKLIGMAGRPNPDSAVQVEYTSTPSFSTAVLREVNHPVAEMCGDLRQIESLRSKFVVKYLAALVGDRIHYNLHQMKCDFAGGFGGTVTGRFSSSDINVQQVLAPSIQDGVTKPWIIRKLFTAPPGRRFIAADMSQIELRVFAWMTRDPVLIGEFNTPGFDLHTYAAEITGLIRAHAKWVTFAKIYGAGIQKIAIMIGKSYAEAKECVRQYEARFPQVDELDQRIRAFCRRRGYVSTVIGRRRHYETGDSMHTVMNAAIQGTAADALKLQFARLPEICKRFDLLPLFTVHDEVCFEGPEDLDCAALKAELDKPVFKNCPVPMPWDVVAADTWADCK